MSEEHEGMHGEPESGPVGSGPSGSPETVPDDSSESYQPVGALDMAVYHNVRASLFGAEAIPPRMGRYAVLGTLGRGGMGTVLRAFDLELDRQVALKVLHGYLGERQTTRLRREAQAMARVSHPNVVQVYEVGQVEGRTFVAMELVRGRTLREWMNQRPRPGWRACVRLFVSLGEGLFAAHEQGLVHRDFKPDNAIIDDSERPRLLDFGLARRDEPAAPELVQTPMPAMEAGALQTSLTRTGGIVGTPAYMPPEQVEGQDIDARSDQFSFCVSLYEALYGERPFEGDSVSALMTSIRADDARPASREARVPARLRSAILRGLSSDPSQRWPSMRALLTELRRIAARPLRRVMGLGLAVFVVVVLVATRMVLQQEAVIEERDEEISQKQTRIEQQLVELQRRDRRLTAELHAQMGLRATMLAADEGHELQAVALAVAAFGDASDPPRSVSPPVFEGLTRALTKVHAGLVLRGHEGWVLGVAPSPDGEWVATAGADKTVRLWDATTGALLQTLEGHTGVVRAVAWSPDGRWLASASDDRTARLWDARTGTTVSELVHAEPVRDVAVSPGGNAVATASTDAAWVWHEGADVVVVPRLGHRSPVWSVAFSPDGEQLLTTDDDGSARLWSARHPRLLLTLEGHEGAVLDGEFTRDGRRIVTAGEDRTVRVWDAATGEPISMLEHHTEVHTVAVSDDGVRIAFGGFDDQAAWSWEPEKGRIGHALRHGGPVTDVAFSPRHRRLLTASWDQTVRMWNLDPGQGLSILDGAGRIEAVASSPDGSRLATGNGDGTVWLWDPQTREPLVVMHGHGLDVLDVAFSADGAHLVTASWDGTARLWNASSGEPERVLEGHVGPVRAVAPSPDGMRVATGGRDGTARVWDVVTGQPQQVLSHGAPVVALVLAAEDRLLTLDESGTVRAWDASTGATEALPAGWPDGAVTALARSPDGRRLAIATSDPLVYCLALESGELLTTIDAHRAPVRAMTFSSDGTQLATASDDGTARAWNVASGELLAVLPHEVPVEDVTFSSDGGHLATASGEAAARVWSLEPEAWLGWGCRVLATAAADNEDTARVCESARPAADSTGRSSPWDEPSVIVAEDQSMPDPETITVHGVELVLVPGGRFTMGSPLGLGGDEERPQHEVELSSFYLARTEVTNAQYRRYLEANPDAREPAGFGDERFARPQHPVVGLTWYEAEAYCEWAGLSLPTEAQWEYAARAGSGDAYWFGDDPEPLHRFAWLGNNSGLRTREVGTRPANPFGLYDLNGNVQEWCRDGNGSYDIAPRPGDGLRVPPRGDDYRIMRGGAWVSPPDVARSGFRSAFSPGSRFGALGFRPALNEVPAAD